MTNRKDACPAGMCVDGAKLVAEERERCAKLVPTNWIDPLLSGQDAVKLPLDETGLEKLLLAVQKRIRADQ